MSAPTAPDPQSLVNPFLESEAAVGLLNDLRRATDGRTGDRLSGAIRAVTTSGAIAAITLLLSDYDSSLLDGAADEQALREWLHNVDTDLTPGRQLAASAALARIELNLDNEWYTAHQAAGTLPAALRSLRRLRDGLADAT